MLLCNGMKNVFRRDAVPNRAKNKKSIDEKSFYSNTSHGFEYNEKKNQSRKSLCLPNVSEF